MFTFTSWFYKLFLRQQLLTNDLQSSCLEKFSKINRKTLVMEFSFIYVGDCNFTIKELHQRFSSKFLSLWNFTSILKTTTILLLLHFDSYPAQAIIISLTKQMNTLSDQSFRAFFCFCEIVWPKKVGTFLLKCQRWSPVLTKLQDKVSKTGLQHFLLQPS